MIKLEKKETLTAEETKQILDNFYVECLNFWQREANRDYKIKKEDVEKIALRDVKCIKRDPTVPWGRYLDVTAKEEWVQEKEKQLSEKNKDPYLEALVIQENYGLGSNIVEWDNKKFLEHLKQVDIDAYKQFIQLREQFKKMLWSLKKKNVKKRKENLRYHVLIKEVDKERESCIKWSDKKLETDGLEKDCPFSLLKGTINEIIPLSKGMDIKLQPHEVT